MSWPGKLRRRDRLGKREEEERLGVFFPEYSTTTDVANSFPTVSSSVCFILET